MSNLPDNTACKPSSVRLGVFDALKGIAILLVVADHCGLPLCAVLDYFEVPAFFVISGYFFRHKGSASGTIVSKAKRLIVPYIAYNVLYILAKAAMDGDLTFGGTVRGVLFSANYPLWYFKALFCTFILGIVFTRNGRWVSPRYVGLVAVGFAAVGIGMGFVALPDATIVCGLSQAVVVFPLFCFGLFLQASGLARRVGVLFSRPWVSFLAGGGTLCICSLVWHGAIGLNEANIGNVFVFYPYATVVFLGFYLVMGAMGKRIEATLAFVGRKSLFIFCIHAIIILYVRELVGNSVAVFAIVACLSVFLASVAERVPWLRRAYLA